MGHSHEIVIKEEKFEFTAKTKRFSLTLLAVGLILTVIGIFTLPKDNATHTTDHASVQTSDHHEEKASASDASHAESMNQAHDATTHDAKPWYVRIYANLLLNGYFLLLLSIGGLFFVALQYIANAGWSAVLKRIPEAMATFLPIAGVIVIIAVLLGKDDLYHWAHYEHLGLTKNDPGFDEILASKSWFLNTPFFLTAIVIIIAVWFLYSRMLKKLSLLEDAQGGITFFNKSIRLSAAFTFIYAFSFSVLSWLLIMSIDAHWYSTIFSIYNFATGWVSTLTVICLLVLWLKAKGYLNVVTDEHIHDLGKFMFAFSIFWTYLWVSQYLLIWYAQIPEEVAYYMDRQEGYFRPQFFINIGLNFIVPFLVLMTRDNKRNPKILSLVGAIILIGHWNDIYLMIMPGTIGHQAKVGILEIGMTLFFAGLFIYWVLNALSKHALIATKHPYIQESANHDVGL